MKPTPNRGRPVNRQTQGDALSRAFCEHVLQIVRERAHHYRFLAEEDEDVAGSFLAHILEDPDTFFRHRLQGDALEAWLFRCADNWAINAYRYRKYHSQREISLIRAPSQKAGPVAWEIPDVQPPPDIGLIREEFRRRVRTAVVLLPPAQKALYVAYYVHDKSIAELARSSHRTVNAVRLALWDLRRRMRRLLELGGLNAQEANDYLYRLS